MWATCMSREFISEFLLYSYRGVVGDTVVSGPAHHQPPFSSAAPRSGQINAHDSSAVLLAPCHHCSVPRRPKPAPPRAPPKHPLYKDRVTPHLHFFPAARSTQRCPLFPNRRWCRRVMLSPPFFLLVSPSPCLMFPVAFLCSRFHVQVLPPQLPTTLPHHRVHRRRPNPVSFRAPIAAKWTPHVHLLLLVPSAHRLITGSVDVTGPPRLAFAAPGSAAHARSESNPVAGPGHFTTGSRAGFGP
jgi:hypothetical protein